MPVLWFHEVADYWEQIVKINTWQQERISSIVVKNLFGTLSNKKLAILGFSFKANTNDTRESPSIAISKNLLKEGSKLNFYDPKVNKDDILKEFQENKFEKNLNVCETVIDAAKGADAIIVLTEWEEFSNLDWNSIFQVMRKPSWVFDSRSYLNTDNLRNIGFKVWTLGQS